MPFYLIKLFNRNKKKLREYLIKRNKKSGDHLFDDLVNFLGCQDFGQATEVSKRTTD